MCVVFGVVLRVCYASCMFCTMRLICTVRSVLLCVCCDVCAVCVVCCFIVNEANHTETHCCFFMCQDPHPPAFQPARNHDVKRINEMFPNPFGLRE